MSRFQPSEYSGVVDDAKAWVAAKQAQAEAAVQSGKNTVTNVQNRALQAAKDVKETEEEALTLTKVFSWGTLLIGIATVGYVGYRFVRRA